MPYSSRDSVFEALENFLSEKDKKIISISGNWGCGKSHLVDSVLHKTGLSFIKISLFGLRSIEDLKLSLVQSSIGPNGLMAKELKKNASDLLSVFSKLAGGFNFNLNKILIASYAALLKDRLIVIDDIERKNKDLEIDEVLGFINDLAENNNNKFILILNSNNLDGRDLWESFHEKVIDSEVRLNPSPSEAFELALNSKKKDYFSTLENSLEILEVNNIRVIKKIISNIDMALQPYGEINEPLLSRVITSIALLTAINYKATPKLPSLDFVVKFNSLIHHMNVRSTSLNADSNEAKWADLMDALDISHGSEFELTFKQYLETGLMQRSEITTFIEDNKYSIDTETARKKAAEFKERYLWDASLTAGSIVQQYYPSFVGNVAHLDPIIISEFFLIAQTVGEEGLGQNLVNTWIAHFNKKYEDISITPEFFRNVNPNLNKDILTAVRALKETKIPPVSLFDAVTGEDTFNPLEGGAISTITNSTASDYESLLLSLDYHKLPVFLRNQFKWLANAQTLSKEPYRTAFANFAFAAKSIYNADQNSRISKILANEFALHNLPNFIDSIPHAK